MCQYFEEEKCQDTGTPLVSSLWPAHFSMNICCNLKRNRQALVCSCYALCFWNKSVQRSNMQFGNSGKLKKNFLVTVFLQSCSVSNHIVIPILYTKQKIQLYSHLQKPLYRKNWKFSEAPSVPVVKIILFSFFIMHKILEIPPPML